MKKYRTYSKEFKENAISLWLDTNRSSMEVSTELGINDGTLRKWREILRPRDKDQPDEQPNPTVEKPEDELKRLRKDLAETKMELEIIKKAVAIFSNPRKS